jgi:hypothetical protein
MDGWMDGWNGWMDGLLFLLKMIMDDYMGGWVLSSEFEERGKEILTDDGDDGWR